MIVKHYSLLKKYEGERRAILQIKTHALAYLKNIPGTKEIKQKIANSKTEEEFFEIINYLYDFVK